MSLSLRAQLALARDALFPRRCAKKMRYFTERAAKGALRVRLTSERERPEELHHYRCPHCNGWHLTKMRQNG